MQHEQFDTHNFDYARLSPERRQIVKQWAMRRAKEERDAVLGALFLGLWESSRRAAKLALAPVKAWRAWRSRQTAGAELASLDDHTLKDIGISRAEIASVVVLADQDTTRYRATAGHHAQHQVQRRGRAA